MGAQKSVLLHGPRLSTDSRRPPRERGGCAAETERERVHRPWERRVELEMTSPSNMHTPQNFPRLLRAGVGNFCVWAAEWQGRMGKDECMGGILLRMHVLYNTAWKEKGKPSKRRGFS